MPEGLVQCSASSVILVPVVNLKAACWGGGIACRRESMFEIESFDTCKMLMASPSRLENFEISPQAASWIPEASACLSK